MQQGVAAGQHIEIVGVAAADDAGQRQAAGADRVGERSARARLGPVAQGQPAQPILDMRVDPGIVEDEIRPDPIEHFGQQGSSMAR